MGCFSTYCAFCSGPFDDAYDTWHRFVLDDRDRSYPPKDGQWRGNPPGYPVPTKERSELIRITPEDGIFWLDWVCIAPLWPSHTSPACTTDSYGGIFINDVDMGEEIGRTWRFHHACLSFFCRFTNSTPQSLYESLNSAHYLSFSEKIPGMLYCVEYFDMEHRAKQDFEYATRKYMTLEEHQKTGDSWWYDPDTMEDCNWLLARPTIFPVIPTNPNFAYPTSDIVTPEAQTASSTHPKPAAQEVFCIPELLDMILSALVQRLPRITIGRERAVYAAPPSLAAITRVVFDLLSVSKHVHNYFITSRQDLFLSLAWQHSWMLPCTPMDGRSWNAINPSIPLSDLRPIFGSNKTSFRYQPPSRDWRAYLLTFLRKDTPHVRNRWRMYRMAMQFAVGKGCRGRKDWSWSCGDQSHVPMPFQEGMEEDWELPPDDEE